MSEYITVWVDDLPDLKHGEEITRCRDCKHAFPMYDEDGNKMANLLDCYGKLTSPWDYYNDEPQDNPVEPDGFCAWGERRDA